MTEAEPETAVSASLQKIKLIKNQHKLFFFIFYFIKSQTSYSFVNHFDGNFAYLKTLDFSFKDLWPELKCGLCEHHLKCQNNHQHDCGHPRKEEEEISVLFWYFLCLFTARWWWWWWWCVCVCERERELELKIFIFFCKFWTKLNKQTNHSRVLDFQVICKKCRCKVVRSAFLCTCFFSVIHSSTGQAVYRMLCFTCPARNWSATYLWWPLGQQLLVCTHHH